MYLYKFTCQQAAGAWHPIKTRTLVCPFLILFLQISSHVWSFVTFGSRTIFIKRLHRVILRMFTLQLTVLCILQQNKCFSALTNPHNQPPPFASTLLLPPSAGLSRGCSMGKPMGGDCDLDLANRRTAEAASDLVSANGEAAASPIGNSRRVPEPCASLMLGAREADRDTERGGKQTNHADFMGFHAVCLL